MDGQTDIHLFQSPCTKRSRISKFLLSWFMIWLDVGLGWVVAVEIFQFDVMHAMPVRICCLPQLRLPGCLSEIAVKLIINSEGYCRENGRRRVEEWMNVCMDRHTDIASIWCLEEIRSEMISKLRLILLRTVEVVYWCIGVAVVGVPIIIYADHFFMDFSVLLYYNMFGQIHLIFYKLRLP